MTERSLVYNAHTFFCAYTVVDHNSLVKNIPRVPRCIIMPKKKLGVQCAYLLLCAYTLVKSRLIGAKYSASAALRHDTKKKLSVHCAHLLLCVYTGSGKSWLICATPKVLDWTGTERSPVPPFVLSLKTQIMKTRDENRLRWKHWANKVLPTY